MIYLFKDIYQHNNLYSYMDTCLSNIESIYLISGDKKRKLLPGSVVPTKVKAIFIMCKVRKYIYLLNFVNISRILRI